MVGASIILSLLSATAAYPLTRRDGPTVPGLDYQNSKVRGVNVGGWLVLEPYMNPSFFNQGWDPANIPVDEYHLTKAWGKDKSQQVLEKHWDTWIQESDFEKMASWGLNLARLPIGYWAFIQRPEDPYVQGQVKYLDRAVEWARKHGIKVWIDLHGVPGSQNGFDNSGLRDHYEWQDDNTSNMKDTYAALDKLIDRYGGPEFYDVVVGIEPVNEPLGAVLDMNKLHDYYNQSYTKIRQRGPLQGAIFHDAYKEVGYTNDWLNTPDFYNVVIDHHFYQVFNKWQLELSIDDHVKAACDLGTQMKQTDNKWHVVGEWSAALTDCTPVLNGVYRGSRYDGSYDNSKAIGSCAGINDISQWSNEQKQNTRKFAEAQLDAYEHGGSGWIIWAYKTENSIEWDLSRLIENGLFPNPVTERQYKNQCGY